jgi:hypothetical protein
MSGDILIISFMMMLNCKNGNCQPLFVILLFLSYEFVELHLSPH